MGRALVLLGIVATALPNEVFAHKLNPAIATIEFSADGTYQLTLRANLEALLAGVAPQHTDTNESPAAASYDQLRRLSPEQLGTEIARFTPTLLTGMELRFDTQRVTPAFDATSVDPIGDLDLPRETRVTFRGTTPPGVTYFTWAYAAAFGNNVLKLRNAVDDTVVSAWLKDGARSEPYTLHQQLVPKTRAEVALRYAQLGFTHIVPKGLDHIAFVLGIFLLSTRLTTLLWQVTAFTIAHTITLGLTMYGVVSLSATIVEPLIALSIVYVGVENLLIRTLKLWRVALVFGFGLLHGMGFAGVLRDIGLPANEFLTALLTFNLGVELGQLSVVSIAFLLVGGWFRNKTWYRQRITIPGSLAIAVLGTWWLVERTFL